jgi:RNA polymerase sigma-70 factor (ECF subfamily)
MTTTRVTTITGEEGTAAGTTNRRLFPSEGRPDAGAAAAYVGELFSAHGRMVLGLCRLLLRDPVEAEDAAQQVFVSAHRALLGGAVPREPAAWLAAIARNECRARIRTRMRAPLKLPELPADIADPLSSAIHAADLDALWAALSELPRRQRKAFLLRELGGLSYGELGVALGVTRPAVESLLFRARQQLRDAMATLNAALVPLALRDQLARFLPFGTPGGDAPFAAKVAAVTVGVGLGAAGVVELPKRHVHHVRTSSPAAAPVAVHAKSPDIAFSPAPVVASGGEESRRQDRGENGRDREHQREVEHEARDPSQQVERQSEQPQQAQAETSDQENHLSRSSSDSGDRGDSGGGSGD